MSTPYGIGSFFGTYEDAGTAPKVNYKGIGEGSAADRSLVAVKADFSSESEIDDVNNGNGDPSGYHKKRGKYIVDLELVIRATSLAGMITASIPPGDLQTIVLSNFIKSDQTWINGNWVYKSGVKVATSDEGELKMTFQVERKFKGNGTEVTPATLLAAIA